MVQVLFLTHASVCYMHLTHKISASLLIFIAGAVGLVWAYLQFTIIAKIAIVSSSSSGEEQGLLDNGQDAEKTLRLKEIYQAIYEGAESFLRAEYRVCFWFVSVFAVVILVLVSWGTGWDAARGCFTAISFLLGAFTSMGSGYLGMKVAVFSNVRTTVEAQKPGWTSCFNTAFRAGAVMGFSLCAAGLLMLYATSLVFKLHYPKPSDWVFLTESLTGYGLGGSVIAMFGRVGGGIYTKAAEYVFTNGFVFKLSSHVVFFFFLSCHSQQCGSRFGWKSRSWHCTCRCHPDVDATTNHFCAFYLTLSFNCLQQPEDDPRNPATIADNVGDNVGDVAGMGSDLFGSFAESTCAALVIGSGIGESYGWDAMVFPVTVSAVGIFVCLICSFIATHIKTVKKESDVELALKIQLISTTLLMIPAVYYSAAKFLPASFAMDQVVGGGTLTIGPGLATICVSMGAVGGLIIGLVTEYYTSHSYAPVREVANSCKTGAATNMIYGIALGYKSAIIPVLVLAVVVYASFTLCDMYGVALAAIGFLSNLATGLTIDVYGPVCDNAVRLPLGFGF